MNCRHCNHPLEHVFCDLQTCPPSNAMIKSNELNLDSNLYPVQRQQVDSERVDE